jgi:hypothetical protein
MKALTKNIGRRSALAACPAACPAACAVAYAAASLLFGASARAADGPYAAAAYSYSGYETDCDGSVSCDRRSSGFRLAAGWRFAGNWTAEALYLDAGHFDASAATSAGTIFYGRARLTAAGATLGYDWRLGTDFTVGPRAGLTAVRANFSPGAAPAIAGGATTAQFLGGAAAAWRISDAWSLRLDWDHTRGRMNRFNGDVNAASLGVQFGF